jgi:hypothetical protein
MKDSQNLNPAFFNAISHDVRGSNHDQLERSVYSTTPPFLGEALKT